LDKEMQRNMLLAIAISILIMMVWTRFFAPKPTDKQAQQQEQIAEQATEQAYERPADPATPVAPGSEPAADFFTPPEFTPLEELANAQDVVVETPHMIATFTTLGGRLTSLRLPGYKSKQGDHEVDLVPQSEEMKWPLALKFNDVAFGVRNENFVYEHRLYESSDAERARLFDALARSSTLDLPDTPQAEIYRRILESLPDDVDADLRSVVVAIAGEKNPPDKSEREFQKQAEGGLTTRGEMLSRSTFLVFSRQMTPQLRFVKAFVFSPDAHSFDMYTILRNTSAEPLDVGQGKASYSIEWEPGLESSERTAKVDELVGVHLVEKDYKQKAVRKLKQTREFGENLTWIGLKRKYFFLVLEPSGGLMAATMEPLGTKEERVRVTLDMQPITLAAGEMAANHVRLCAGPMLKDVLESLGPEFNQIINFGFFDIFGKFLLTALLWFNKYVQNYGIAIILLTIVVRVGLFPLNQKSYKSMKEMQSLQPLVNELREKYKKNPQEMNKRMMALYREHKVNPMGGCLPLAFQMPVFIALFQALRYAVELRGAHFLWITDLSEPDRLDQYFTALTSIAIPFNLPINLLPLLVIVAMLIQQKMTPVAGGQSESQQKMMQYMPIIFGFLFYTMPSGLTVYFLISTVLGLVQQYFVQKAA